MGGGFVRIPALEIELLPLQVMQTVVEITRHYNEWVPAVSWRQRAPALFTSHNG